MHKSQHIYSEKLSEREISYFKRQRRRYGMPVRVLMLQQYSARKLIYLSSHRQDKNIYIPDH